MNLSHDFIRRTLHSTLHAGSLSRAGRGVLHAKGILGRVYTSWLLEKVLLLRMKTPPLPLLHASSNSGTSILILYARNIQIISTTYIRVVLIVVELQREYVVLALILKNKKGNLSQKRYFVAKIVLTYCEKKLFQCSRISFVIRG